MADPALDARLLNFMRYYADVLAEVRELPHGRHGGTLRKLCLLSVIDALAKSVYPTRGNRDRFTRLVRQFGDWDHCTRVSLPHLRALLDRAPDPEFEPLRVLANERLGAWLPGSVIELDNDLELELARGKWPKDSALKFPVGNVSLESLQHSHLLYAYRNLLVHEFRSRRDPLDMDDRVAPVYLTELELERPVSWYLLYPTGFFQALADRVVANVGEYLSRNALDPTIHFSSAEYLVDELCD